MGGLRGGLSLHTPCWGSAAVLVSCCTAAPRCARAGQHWAASVPAEGNPLRRTGTPRPGAWSRAQPGPSVLSPLGFPAHGLCGFSGPFTRPQGKHGAAPTRHARPFPAPRAGRGARSLFLLPPSSFLEKPAAGLSPRHGPSPGKEEVCDGRRPFHLAPEARQDPGAGGDAGASGLPASSRGVRAKGRQQGWVSPCPAPRGLSPCPGAAAGAGRGGAERERLDACQNSGAAAAKCCVMPARRWAARRKKPPHMGHGAEPRHAAGGRALPGSTVPRG